MTEGKIGRVPTGFHGGSNEQSAPREIDAELYPYVYGPKGLSIASAIVGLVWIVLLEPLLIFVVPLSHGSVGFALFGQLGTIALCIIAMRREPSGTRYAVAGFMLTMLAIGIQAVSILVG